jgi:phosphatidylserine decarboxylase
MSLNLILQYLLPHHILSRLVGKIANCRISLVKNLFIWLFCKLYQIDMTETVEENRFKYPTFNDFFTRSLKTDARPIASGKETIVSPVDGKVWQIGKIDEQKVIYAKGHEFNLEKLFADKDDAEDFIGANFAVLYLAPYNYHRIHMPIQGQLKTMRYIPGKLFSVNPKVIHHIPYVFAKNERVITMYDTPCGKMAAIFVGAMIVGSIETKWAGVVAPSKIDEIVNWDYWRANTVFKAGDEIGRFKLGSTVILLFPENSMQWDKKLCKDSPVKMGERIGTVL